MSSNNKIASKQVINRAALPVVGSAANESLNLLLPRVESELGKLFEDRNISLADGGLLSYNGSGTQITFTQNLQLHVNSKIAGGAPVIIDLGGSPWAFSVDGKMTYAVLNRTAGTAVVTTDSSTLPISIAANIEVYLLAKRVDSADATKTVFFRDGTWSLEAGQTARLGSSPGSSPFNVNTILTDINGLVLVNEFGNVLVSS